MLEEIILEVQKDLAGELSGVQLEKLVQVLRKHLSGIVDAAVSENEKKSEGFLEMFIAAKRVEGCSEKSLRYYESTIRNMLEGIGKPERNIATEDLRGYLDAYQRRGICQQGYAG